MKEKVLRAIEEANEEDSKIYLQAAVRRREYFLDGGEVHCHEYSKEFIKYRDELERRVAEIEREEKYGTKT